MNGWGVKYSIGISATGRNSRKCDEVSMSKANTVCVQEDSPEECEQKVKKIKYAKI